MITGIHHVSAFTKSAVENEAFYTQVLGLRLVKQTVNQEDVTMRHLFYGDYQGTPGTLLSFFEVPQIGRSYRNNHYFETVTLGIPKGTLDWWKLRLEKGQVTVMIEPDSLVLEDGDSLRLKLVEINEVIASGHATIHSDVPREKQIIRILGIDLFVPSPEDTMKTMENYLGLVALNTHELADENGNSFTAIYPSKSLEESRTGRGTIDHIAYRVTKKEAVDQLHEQAKQLGLMIEMFMDRGYSKCLYVKDSSGLRIEVASDEPGLLLDEDLETLGTHLALPAFLENRRAEIEAHLE